MRGIGVSPGMAIGAAVVVQSQLPDVPHRVVPRSQVEREVRRLRAAVKDVQRHIADLKARTEERIGPDEARIFDAQMLMLEDKDFLGAVEDLIRENHLTAEKAFEFKALEQRDAWTSIGNARLKDRIADLNGVMVRVVRHLMHLGNDDEEGFPQGSIVVARELGPGLTVQLDRAQVVGIVSEEGTRTSHAAILWWDGCRECFPAFVRSTGPMHTRPPPGRSSRRGSRCARARASRSECVASSARQSTSTVIDCSAFPGRRR